jgi:hypothetical protein
MIYLKSRKLLFIKPLKTASTSLEIAFSCNACPEDIVTPISTKDELLRLKMGGQMPVNYAQSRSVERRYDAKVRMIDRLGRMFPNLALETQEKLVKPFYRTKGRKPYFNHIKPAELVAQAGKQILDDSFVVTMCRHPYEVLVSRVYWERWKKERATEFDVSAAIDLMLESEPLNLDYYFYEGEFIPDFVVRYENLTEDLERLESMQNLELLKHMPFTKNAVRKTRTPASEMLSDTQKKVCYEKNRLIFEKFGYVA